MSKVVINEEKLHQIISESIEKNLSEAFGQKLANRVGQEWGTMKQQGVVPYLSGKLGQAAGKAQNWVNDIRKSYRDGVDIARGNSLGKHPADALTADQKEKIQQVRGRDENGNNKFALQKYLDALKAHGLSDADAIQMARNAGYNIPAQNTGDVQGPEAQERLANNTSAATAQSASTQAATAQTTAAQTTRRRGFQPKAARPIADIQAQVTNGQLMSKADGQIVAAALGEYKKNHPEINEGIIREAVAKAVRKYINKQNK